MSLFRSATTAKQTKISTAANNAVCGKWSFKVWVKALCPIFCTSLAVSVAGERMLVIGPVFLYQA